MVYCCLRPIHVGAGILEKSGGNRRKRSLSAENNASGGLPQRGRRRERIAKINRTMKEYLDGGIFREYRNEMIYTERTLSDGRVRKGIVGAVDLSEYDYEAGSRSMIRATEGTVLSRIPPRVRIRENAPLELPHIMILIDDPGHTVIPEENAGEIVYDTELMLGGGHIRGSLMGREGIEEVTRALERLAVGREQPLLFAVGDGNIRLPPQRLALIRESAFTVCACRDCEYS